MEKVKLTKEQANAIEWALQKENEYSPDRLLRLRSSDNANFHNELYPLNDIDIAVLARALYIGYEVETKFELGDWVVPKETSGGFKIEIKPYQITIKEEKRTWLDCKLWVYDKQIRHATPEEIEKEKERRWWARHGREVWELKVGDVLKDVTDGYTDVVESLYEMHVEFSDGVQYTKDGIKKYCRIVCFAEDRKDIGDN